MRITVKQRQVNRSYEFQPEFYVDKRLVKSEIIGHTWVWIAKPSQDHARPHWTSRSTIHRLADGTLVRYRAFAKVAGVYKPEPDEFFYAGGWRSAPPSWKPE